MISFSIQKDLEGRSAMVFEKPFIALGNFFSSSVRTNLIFKEIRKSIHIAKEDAASSPLEIGFDSHDLVISVNEISIEPYYGQSDSCSISIVEFEKFLDEWEKVVLRD